MTEKEAFIKLGHELLSTQFGTKQLDDHEAEQAARSWFRLKIDLIKSCICGNATVHQAFTDNIATARNSALTAALDSLFSQHYFDGIPAATITNAVVCYGIYKICSEHDG